LGDFARRMRLKHSDSRDLRTARGVLPDTWEDIMKLAIRLLSLMIVTALVSALVLAAENGVKQVGAKHICFITKKRFDRTLKSVTVEGKNYYGCCDDCLAKLTNDPSSRKDIDPVTGAEVDKAAAFIGMDRNGNVYFFESLENLKNFRVPIATPVR
jgi:YHS domain-containing protein